VIYAFSFAFKTGCDRWCGDRNSGDLAGVPSRGSGWAPAFLDGGVAGEDLGITRTRFRCLFAAGRRPGARPTEQGGGRHWSSGSGEIVGQPEQQAGVGALLGLREDA
jgi:hypothetical protein